MTCTLTHDADGIPEWLCRWCHPELNNGEWRRVEKPAPVAEPVVDDSQLSRYEKKMRRRVRAEVKQLRLEWAKLEKRDDVPKTQKDAFEAKLRSAERELYLLS